MLCERKILLICCIWLNVNNTWVEGEFDYRCTVGCACCKYNKCGPGNYFSNECTLGCIDGYRGALCEEKCTHNCTKCPTDIDKCTACYDGYYPGSTRDCTSKCLHGCKTCASGTTCTSCKKGYDNAVGQNDCSIRKCPETCNCDNGQCASCKDGYFDTSDKCNSLCPGNCVTCSSNTDCGSCREGYYKGYQNDNINHPLLNDCTSKCRDNCVQCSSYNNCSICKTGRYGSNCENSCSMGCMSNTCDILTGKCDCFPKFAGERCDKCKTGKYGNMCDQQCPAWCKGNVCEQYSGDCTDGCTIDTIVGVKCDACSTGWYGQYCNMSCSVGCKNQQCKKSNGECSNGCLDNFVGGQCNQCKPGKYGESCHVECPNNCDENGCLKESGNCINCNDNFDGEKCDRCRHGFYGSLCSEKCPLTSDSSSSGNTAAISLGTILAVSFVVNMIFVATMILRKYRKRVNDTYNTKGPVYENSGIELECGVSGNAGSVSKHGIVQAIKSDTVLNSPDYEDLGRVQVSEHEYGEIRPDT